MESIPTTVPVAREMTAPGWTRPWLRAEGVAAFVAGLALYGWLGGWWLAVVPLLLLPDASMIGYLRGPRLGAITYNLAHNWALGLRPEAADLVPRHAPRADRARNVGLTGSATRNVA